ncbi:MAG: CHAD domain-containing protein [Acetobacteraceae bacterium]
MRLELAIAADDAGRVARLKPFAAERQNRGKPIPHRILWHDSPDRILAERGQVLSESQGIWRLQPLSPAAAGCPPAATPPVLDEAESRETITADLPEPLIPIAAFQGRDVLYPLLGDNEPVTVTLRRGVVRAVAAEHPIARVIVEGPPQGVRAVALLLANAARVTVPRTSLAAEALALVGGVPFPDPGGGPGPPPDGCSAQEALRHVLGQLTHVLLHEAPRAADDQDGPEPVHQMRVAVRRMRSAISVFRMTLNSPQVAAVNQDLKDLAARLGPTRDWDVFVTETIRAVTGAIPADPHLHRLVTAAEERRHACHAALQAYLRSPAFRVLAVELAWLAGTDAWGSAGDEPAPAVADFAPAALRARWRKLLNAGKRIEELDVPALHDLRLRAKRARYTAELFVPLYPGKAPRRFVRRLSRLQQGLGLLNDGTVARHLLDELGGPDGPHAHAVGLVLGFVAAHSADIRPTVLKEWEKISELHSFWS